MTKEASSDAFSIACLPPVCTALACLLVNRKVRAIPPQAQGWSGQRGGHAGQVMQRARTQKGHGTVQRLGGTQWSGSQPQRRGSRKSGGPVTCEGGGGGGKAWCSKDVRLGPRLALASRRVAPPPTHGSYTAGSKEALQGSVHEQQQQQQQTPAAHLSLHARELPTPGGSKSDLSAHARRRHASRARPAKSVLPPTSSSGYRGPESVCLQVKGRQ